MTSWRDKYSGDETTMNELRHTMYTTRTSIRPLHGFENRTADFDKLSLEVDCDEVYPNIFIGDEAAAKSIPYLKMMGITHVLNTAEGIGFGMVNTSRTYYRNTNIRYMGLQLQDLPMTNIGLYFDQTADFIEDAIRSGGKVLVHCLMGMSRSSTCVLSYLMIKRRLTANEALRLVRQHRVICPNDGFLQQLADLDNKLQRVRGRMSSL